MPDRTIISFDYAIKTVLRDKANFGILEGFLSELLGKDISIVDLLESESNAKSKTLKTNRVDLMAKIDGGEIAIIELQFADQIDFFGKILYAASKAIVEQMPKGGKYNVKKIYSINVLYFDVGAKREYIFRADMLNFLGIHSNEKIPFAQNDNLAPPSGSPSYIHPEYYLVLPAVFDEYVKNGADEWVYVLKKSEVKKSFKARGIKEAGIKLDELKMTRAQRTVYEKYLMDRQCLDSSIWTAEMKGEARGIKTGVKKGEAIGIKKGEAIGIKKGEAIGIKKGVKKGVKKGEAIGIKKGVKKGEAIGVKKGVMEEKKRTARAMKADGINAKTIAKITGLTVDAVKKA